MLNEFFAVVTSQGRGGVTHPRSQDAAWAEVENYLESETIVKIHPTASTLQRLGELFATYHPLGRRVFDLYLVATMLENGVTRMYTYNTRHFSPIREVEVLVPPAAHPEPRTLT